MKIIYNIFIIIILQSLLINDTQSQNLIDLNKKYIKPIHSSIISYKEFNAWIEIQNFQRSSLIKNKKIQGFRFYTDNNLEHKSLIDEPSRFLDSEYKGPVHVQQKWISSTSTNILFYIFSAWLLVFGLVKFVFPQFMNNCLLYTSDAADE